MIRLLSALLLATLSLTPVHAQDAPPSAPQLALELNALQPGEAGCRVSFLATNRLAADLDRTAVEIAFFTGDGAIDRIVTLDFLALPQGKTKVLQFELQGLNCEGIGRLLVNDISACEGPEIEAGACLEGLVLSSRPDLIFGL